MASSTPSQPVRVIIRLPYPRPHEGIDIPPHIDWSAEKESILWEVIARSRASDSGGTDWQGLAAHLQVPLPYLLYRAQIRYEEDLKGLQDLRGTFSPTSAQPGSRVPQDEARNGDRPDLVRRISNRTIGSSNLSSSLRINTPLGVRARLNSLGYGSAMRQSKASSSSTLTLQGARNVPTQIRSTSPSPSGSEPESDEEAEKAEEEERRLEEQEALDRKLKDLQAAMTSEALGLVRNTQPKNKGKAPHRGRDLKSPTSPSPLRQTLQRRDLSSSDFNSNSSSPQGSIPSIPSPSSESLPHSPVSRHLPQVRKSSSPPVVTSGHAKGQTHRQYRPMAVGMAKNEQGSSRGSSASSFSDISESTSLSASALESALLSNIRGTGSRFSAFTRSHFNRRPSGAGQQ